MLKEVSAIQRTINLYIESKLKENNSKSCEDKSYYRNECEIELVNLKSHLDMLSELKTLENTLTEVTKPERSIIK